MTVWWIQYFFLVELTFQRCLLDGKWTFTTWYNLFNLYWALSWLKRAKRSWKKIVLIDLSKNSKIDSCIIVNASMFDIQVRQSEIVIEMLPINYPIKLGQQLSMVHRSKHFIMKMLRPMMVDHEWFMNHDHLKSIEILNLTAYWFHVTQNRTNSFTRFT